MSLHFAGTTSLSKASLYGDPENVLFMHESQHGYFLCNNIGAKLWRNFTFEDEYIYVKDKYFPCINSNYLKGHHTVLDLGHHNLFFISALLEYLTNVKSRIPFLLVRLRRDRFETALSLTFKNLTEQYADLCAHEGLMYRYCPYDRQDEVVLSPPNRTAWRGMTVYQHALWMIDEVEARWLKLKEKYPQMNTLEISWGKNRPGSFDLAADAIARLIGVNADIQFESQVGWITGNEHATNTKISVLSETDFIAEDKAYRKAMNYDKNFVPG